jgi:tetratricopeptide (TPR) repeat protein
LKPRRAGARGPALPKAARNIPMNEENRSGTARPGGAAGERPDSVRFVQLGEAFRLQGKHDEAIQACKEGLERMPDALPGRLLLGRCYLEKGMFAEARGELEIVAQVVEECLPVYKLLSQVYLEEKDVDKALEVLRKTLYFPAPEEGKSKKVTPLEMGLLHRGSRPPFSTPPPFQKPAPPPQPPATEEKAEEREKEEDAEASQPPIPTDTLADIYLKQGHLDRALGVYQDILARDPQNAGVKEKYEALRKKIENEKKAESEKKVRASLEKWLAVVSSR